MSTAEERKAEAEDIKASIERRKKIWAEFNPGQSEGVEGFEMGLCVAGLVGFFFGLGFGFVLFVLCSSQS